MQVLAVGRAHPPHYYNQEQLLEAFKAEWSKQHHNTKRVEQLHRAVRVGGRYLALPMEQYAGLSGFGEANDAFIRVATDVAEEAVQQALDQADLKAEDVDAIFFASVTGIATPSIDARLVNRMGFRNDIKRYPLFGLGCVAGAAGIARVNDFLAGAEQGVALLVCVELCSLTLQRGDLSIPNLISSGLFGDGGAAVVAVGKKHSLADRGVGVVASKSRFYPDTERVMGWDIGDNGFKIVLADSVPDLVTEFIRDDVDGFLQQQSLSRDDMSAWICHPGGPKILQAFEESLELPEGALSLTWESLEQVGNMSSASVLFVLADTLAEREFTKGQHGLLMAMGPGFCSELVLLQW